MPNGREFAQENGLMGNRTCERPISFISEHK